MVPQPFLITCWKSFQGRCGSPLCWVEIDLGEVSKPKAEGSKAQKLSIQGQLAGEISARQNIWSMLEKQTSFVSINPIQVKFL